MQNQEILNALANLISNSNKSNSLDIDVAFNIFIQHASVNCRTETINYYKKKFKTLKIGLNQLGINNTNQITKANYDRLINILSYMNLSNATINKTTDLLKGIIKVCNDLEYINNNSIAGIKKLKEKQVKINIISKDIKTEIENYLLNLPKNSYNLRNICLILLLNDTGIRLNELLNIKLKNVFLNKNSIFLDFTKSGKSRFVYFTDLTKSYLIQYLYFHDNINEFLFLNLSNGEKLSKPTIYKFIEKIKKDLNINFSISPHKWRHSLATELVNENVNLNEVMEVLGHSVFSTTKRYLHQENEKIKNDVLRVLNK